MSCDCFQQSAQELSESLHLVMDSSGGTKQNSRSARAQETKEGEKGRKERKNAARECVAARGVFEVDVCERR